MTAIDIGAHFRSIQDKLPGSKLGLLRTARRSALDRFQPPTQEEEDWRFTPAERFAKASFNVAKRPGSVSPDVSVNFDKLILAPLGGMRLVFVDGYFAPELSSGPGACAESLSAALEENPRAIEPFLAEEGGLRHFAVLNTALFYDGALIRIPRGTVVDEPIHLVFVASATKTAHMTHSRVLVSLEAGAQATIVEEYLSVGEGTYFTNVVTQASVSDGARLEHYKLQREGEQALHAATLAVRVERDSSLVSHSVSLGAGLARNDIRILLAAEGASASVNGLYLAKGRQHVDFHTVIEHARPHGTSNELFKGVLDGHARAVFDGSIVVKPEAQKTDARVYNKNLLLSEHGLVNTKPEFKISANDVQCKHGATVGQLSEEALFYLRSRGIGREDARRLLVYAFASEMVVRMGLKPVKDALWELLHARLPRGLES